MTRAEFLDQYAEIVEKAQLAVDTSRREGLLALEDTLDHAKANTRDVFEYGLRFVIDGVPAKIIETVLSNIVAQEQDACIKTLKTIQKEAVLGIQAGINMRSLYALMNSYTDISLEEDPAVEKVFGGISGFVQ
jgi:flagellar motor component MotA